MMVYRAFIHIAFTILVNRPIPSSLRLKIQVSFLVDCQSLSTLIDQESARSLVLFLGQGTFDLCRLDLHLICRLVKRINVSTE